MGLHPSGQHWSIGENAGLIAAQALGERAAQLMLKQTHGGGIVSLNPHTVKDFEDVQRLFAASKRSREDAAVAPHESTIEKVEKLRNGSYSITVSGQRAPLISRQAPLPDIKAGRKVERGEVLTKGAPNVHDVLATQGFDAAQNVMTTRIGAIYSNEGVLRRHVELGVRNTMGLVRVVDPGDHPGILRDDRLMKPVVDEMNRAQGKAPIRYEIDLKPVQTVAQARQTDWMARLMAENLSKSILTGVHHGQASDVTGPHPIPGLAHGASYGMKREHGAHKGSPESPQVQSVRLRGGGGH
jgi:DNA-directed RNA polymerase subunit beta'